MKIEIGEEGTAIIYYRESKWQKYAIVNQETGEYREPLSDLPKIINGKYLGYLQILTQQAEGQKTTWSPEQLKPKTYEDIYKRAINAGVIRVGQNQEGVVFQFHYHDILSILGIFNFLSYIDMDLEENLVRVGHTDRERPLNPHFTQFLKQKKAELELD